MIDRFETVNSGISGPAFDAFSVTPDDSADLSEVTRALYVGGAGDITLITKGGTQIVFAQINAGSFLPIRASRVLAAGTSATNIVGLI